jgi:hypothetical protein
MRDATTLLSALHIAAFERGPDGSFSPLAPPPEWFTRITAGGTFPFLGHILEEANQFWDRRAPGRRDWGPVAEVDKAGGEFHYTVTAINAGDAQYLVLELDPGSDRVREVLQQVRSQALAAAPTDDIDTGNMGNEVALAGTQQRVRQTADEIRALVASVLSVSSASARFEQWKTVSARCGDLVRDVDDLVRAAIASGSPKSSSGQRS